MRTRTLLHRSLTYYWRTNLAVVLGVATAVAVLAGALLVGDSVRASLRDLFLLRLGNADQVISASSFFREKLAADLAADERFRRDFNAACPLIAVEGVVTHEESKRRGAGVQVYGVDERFWKFHEREGTGSRQAPPLEREALVSASLAEELGSKAGDTLLIRVEKPSAIPTESLHGRKEDLGRTLRLQAREVLSPAALGEFSIRPQQTAVRAVFVPLRQLQEDLAQPDRVNTILISEKRSGDGMGEQGAAEERAPVLEKILRDTASLEDLGIRLRVLEDQGSISLESESALINDALLEAARAAAAGLGMRTSAILTYLANSIRANTKEIPYSLVTAVDGEGFARLKSNDVEARRDHDSLTSSSDRSSTPVVNTEATTAATAPIVLNEWAARDLDARPGDQVTLEYFLWGEGGRLLARSAQFRVAGVVPIEGAAADRNLTPEYPGITGTESLADWDPPFPVDLRRVRPRDEDYWDQYRTTPKAFITLEKGQELWQTRFGELTSLRIIPPGEPAALAVARDRYAEKLRAELDPSRMGLVIFPARAQGLEASRGATDFGEYFLYFSFFLVFSALLLTGLFFKLGIEQRLREIGILRAIGFPAATIRALFLSEGIILASAGSAVGLAGAVGYGALMMLGLRTWWVDAVGTTLLTLHVSPLSLALGGAGGITAGMLCIAWTLRRLAPASPRALLGQNTSALTEDGRQKTEDGKQRSANDPSASVVRRFARGLRVRVSAFTAAVVLSIAGASLLLCAALDLIGGVGGFFGAGTLLLVALLCYQTAWLHRHTNNSIEGSGWWPLSRMGFRNTTYRPGRSILCIALIASATFIIVAVDAFRRDSAETSPDRKSGSGGFPLLAETLLPLIHDPNTPEGREALTLDASEDAPLDLVTFTRFRVRPGDDASCLNLYQPRNPKILAPAADFIRSNRFAFQNSLAATKEEKDNPWLLLDKEDAGGAIPVIADANSITYVLHRKLGDEFVINETSARPIRLRLVGALADSVFQSELLMSEKNFLRSFPEQEGHRFFLLDAPPEKAREVSAHLEEELSDFGFDAVSTGDRLAGFHRVENTYLSTFQTLGGLGIILGTLGLATVLLRNVLERRRELALLRAIGYGRPHFAIMAIAENALLLFCGLATGTVCALLAIAPAFFSRGGHLPTIALSVLLLSVLVVGLATSLLATVAALRSPLLPALRAE